MKIYITIEVGDKVVFEDSNSIPETAIYNLKQGIAEALMKEESRCRICGAEDCDH